MTHIFFTPLHELSLLAGLRSCFFAKAWKKKITRKKTTSLRLLGWVKWFCFSIDQLLCYYQRVVCVRRIPALAFGVFCLWYRQGGEGWTRKKKGREERGKEAKEVRSGEDEEDAKVMLRAKRSQTRLDLDWKKEKSVLSDPSVCPAYLFRYVFLFGCFVLRGMFCFRFFFVISLRSWSQRAK